MPERIVSLVPSLTELVWWLGRGDALVGRTRFCSEPPGLKGRVPVIGGTKNPNISKIVGLAPDLVIANKEENRREDVESLRAAGLHVLLTDPNSVDEALATIADIAAGLDASERAGGLIEDVQQLLNEPSPPKRLRVFVAVWKGPLMGLAAETYGDDMLRRAGGINVLGGRARYPTLEVAELKALAPEFILLPDEPYPFKPGDAAAFSEIAPVNIVDGKLLWWYGPRMPQAIRELRAIFGAARR